MHVLTGGDGGWRAADITLGDSQRHWDTNYGFTLLLRLGLTPLHLAAAISTCDILTISLKALVPSCLNYFFPLLWPCRLNSLSPMQPLVILGTFIFSLRSQCLTLSLLSDVLISLL